MSRGRASTGHPAAGAAVVLAITPSGAVIARCRSDRFPSEGDSVSAGHGRFTGTVSRVFGPVDRPYLSIRARAPVPPEAAVALIGSPVGAGV